MTFQEPVWKGEKNIIGPMDPERGADRGKKGSLAERCVGPEEEYYGLEGKTVHEWLPGSIKKPTSMHPTV